MPKITKKWVFFVEIHSRAYGYLFFMAKGEAFNVKLSFTLICNGISWYFFLLVVNKINQEPWLKLKVDSFLLKQQNYF